MANFKRRKPNPKQDMYLSGRGESRRHRMFVQSGDEVPNSTARPNPRVTQRTRDEAEDFMDWLENESWRA